MRKENGRRKAYKNNRATVSMENPFICSSCGRTKTFKNVEFGGTRKCNKCGHLMYELIVANIDDANHADY